MTNHSTSTTCRNCHKIKPILDDSLCHQCFNDQVSLPAVTKDQFGSIIAGLGKLKIEFERHGLRDAAHRISTLQSLLKNGTQS